MMSIGEAYRRSRIYIVCSWLLGAACIAFFVLSGLKSLTLITAQYAHWPQPMAKLGWAVQYAAWYVADSPVLGWFWLQIAPAEMPGWFLRPGFLVAVVLLFVSGLMRRAALKLRAGLRTALEQVQ